MPATQSQRGGGRGNYLAICINLCSLKCCCLKSGIMCWDYLRRIFSCMPPDTFMHIHCFCGSFGETVFWQPHQSKGSLATTIKCTFSFALRCHIAWDDIIVLVGYRCPLFLQLVIFFFSIFLCQSSMSKYIIVVMTLIVIIASKRLSQRGNNRVAFTLQFKCFCKTSASMYRLDSGLTLNFLPTYSKPT